MSNMKPLYKGLIIAALQIALVSSLGAKLLMDRASRPRVWVKTAAYDPNLPIRGRYVSLRLEAEGRGFDPKIKYENANLIVEDNKLVAVAASGGDFPVLLDANRPSTVTLYSPVAYFISEHVQDPSRRAAGEELWIEVTVPKKGPPRPIRLGIKKDDAITPLDLN